MSIDKYDLDIETHKHSCCVCKIEFSCTRSCESMNKPDPCYCPSCWLKQASDQKLMWHKLGCWASYTKEEIKYIKTIEEL